jgi:hypothetical protein
MSYDKRKMSIPIYMFKATKRCSLSVALTSRLRCNEMKDGYPVARETIIPLNKINIFLRQSILIILLINI